MKSTTSFSRFVLGTTIALTVATVSVAPALAADHPFGNVQRQVAANPSNANAILKADLDSLSGRERTRSAAGILAAVYRGLGNPSCEQVQRLYRTALHEAPHAAPSLMNVAHRTCPECSQMVALFKSAVQADPRQGRDLMNEAYQDCPENLTAYLRAAEDAANQAGFSDIIPDLIASARGLNPGGGNFFGGLGIGGATGGGGLGALGGTINPANLGGSTNSASQ